jgi:Tfp pilus assembly protein PilO
VDKLKMYVAFTALGCLFVLVAGWFFLVSPKRAEVAQLNTQAAGQVASNGQLQVQLANLKAKAKDLPKQKAKLAAVAAKIPDNPALPALIRALTTAANAAGVELVTVTPSAPTAVVAAAPGAAPAAPGSPAASTATGGLSQIPLTLNLAGGYFQVEQFIANLENLPRSMRLSNVTMTPGANPMKPVAAGATDDGHTLTATVTGTVFMVGAVTPAAASVVAPPVAAGASAAPAAGANAPTTTTSGPAAGTANGPAVQAPTSSTQESTP